MPNSAKHLLATASLREDAQGRDRISGRGPGSGWVIGIDLGGTKILAGIARSQEQIVATREEPTLHGEDAPVLAQMARLITALLSDVGALAQELDNVVIGVPSAVDPQTGLSSLSPNLALPVDRPLADLMSRFISCPVTVENDVNLAAYGEAWAGAGQGLGSLVFVSFGTGVGMGIVLDGEPWRGAAGRAGEIAYLPVGAAPHATAPLSENGLYEDGVGTSGIRQRFTRDGGTVAELFSLARSGNEQARLAIDSVAKQASIGIAAVHALLDPAVTVIGGGIGSQPEFFTLLQTYLKPLLPFESPLKQSRLGVQAGMIGAVALALKNRVPHPGQSDAENL
ncbi:MULTISPECIES: ROK family protein [Rhizobium/Agrobacterium group]|uniref:ROK family protein n=1 Tax=Rhizobium/Agrobacterium group TaxID=227290 RepID=UPI001F437117|nr:ROK family protein [Allorhizobium ampelinum]